MPPINARSAAIPHTPKSKMVSKKCSLRKFSEKLKPFVMIMIAMGNIILFNALTLVITADIGCKRLISLDIIFRHPC